jgi:hypothetical protein
MPVRAVRQAVDDVVRHVPVHRHELPRIHHQWFTARRTQMMPLLRRRLRPSA